MKATFNFLCLLGIAVMLSCSCSGDGDGDGGKSDDITGSKIVGEWSVYMVSWKDANNKEQAAWYEPGDFYMDFKPDNTFIVYKDGSSVYGTWRDNGDGTLTCEDNSGITVYKMKMVNVQKQMITWTYKGKNLGDMTIHFVRSTDRQYQKYAPKDIIGRKLVWGNNEVQLTHSMVAEILKLDGETNPQLQQVRWERKDLDLVWMTVSYTDGHKLDLMRNYILKFNDENTGTYVGNGENGTFRIEGKALPDVDYAPEELYYNKLMLGTPKLYTLWVVFADNNTVHNYKMKTYTDAKNFRASYMKIEKNKAMFTYSFDYSSIHKVRTQILVFTSPMGGTYSDGSGTFSLTQEEVSTSWAPPYSLSGMKMEK